MSRLITAVVQDKQVMSTGTGTRLFLTFQTTDGHQVIIRAPIEDQYLAKIEPFDQVWFQQDRHGCHHIQRKTPWVNSLLSIFQRKQLNLNSLNKLV